MFGGMLPGCVGTTLEKCNRITCVPTVGLIHRERPLCSPQVHRGQYTQQPDQPQGGCEGAVVNTE